MTQPRYQGVQQEEIPAITADQERVTVNLISGSWGGRTGPITSITEVFMSTIAMRAAGRVGFGSLEGRNPFLYLVRGEVAVNGTDVAAMHLVELDLEGDTVEMVAKDDALLLFGHAAPLGEPVVAHGPFVMNTRQEIVDAIRDYQAGLFEKVSV
jgi:redox-sensitive bicupin YhaK (pirin superfamily)